MYAAAVIIVVRERTEHHLTMHSWQYCDGSATVARKVCISTTTPEDMSQKQRRSKRHEIGISCITPEEIQTTGQEPTTASAHNDDVSSSQGNKTGNAMQVVQIPSQIRRPHPAIRELMNHRKRLDVPSDQCQRALLILHALVRESLRRGWTVTANPSTYETDQWTGRRRSIFPGPDLFTIDAGDAPITVRVSMKTKRVKHVPSEEERKESERWHWPRYPAYDYVTTDIMRVEIRKSPYERFLIEDTATVKLESKLRNMLGKIQLVSDRARELAERRKREEAERLEQARRMEELRRKAAQYERWVGTLDRLRTDIVRHKEYEKTVALLRRVVTDRGADAPHADLLADYLQWAETYLRDSDPFRRIPLPPEGIPEMSYDEWVSWKML